MEHLLTISKKKKKKRKTIQYSDLINYRHHVLIFQAAYGKYPENFKMSGVALLLSCIPLSLLHSRSPSPISFAQAKKNMLLHEFYIVKLFFLLHPVIWIAISDCWSELHWRARCDERGIDRRLLHLESTTTCCFLCRAIRSLPRALPSSWAPRICWQWRRCAKTVRNLRQYLSRIMRKDLQLRVFKCFATCFL